jgi:heat shock protein HslJ
MDRNLKYKTRRLLLTSLWIVSLMLMPALAASEELTMNQLRNAEFSFEWAPGGSFQLSDGEYRSDIVEGSSVGLVVRMGAASIDDLDGDGVDDAVVILITEFAERVRVYDLAIVLNTQGTPVHVATAELGDRIQPLDIEIKSGVITVEMLIQGSADPAYHQPVWVTQTYRLDGNTLLRDQDIVSGQVTIDDSKLFEPRWTWIAKIDDAGVLQTEIGDPSQYTLEFLTDGSYHVKADCNLASGAYSLDGGRLTLGPGPTTLAFCPPGSFSSEFLIHLAGVETWVVEGDRLFLSLADAAGTLVFMQENAAVTGITWQWEGLIETEPASQSLVPHPERYTITLQSDNTLNLQADCNRVLGTYIMDRAELQLELGPSTRAYCGEESLDLQYLDLLTRVEAYEMIGDDLILLLRDDAGRMIFGQRE